jgi:mRNA-degrading endonuclease RelE of RelBE toxin-antitoxin system
MTSYLVRISKQHEEHLEKVPLETALHVEQHLQYIAGLAEVLPADDAFWSDMRDKQSSLFRYHIAGYNLYYDIDHRNCVVRLMVLQKPVPRTQSPAQLEELAPRLGDGLGRVTLGEGSSIWTGRTRSFRPKTRSK